MTSTSILFGQTVPKTGPAALYGESTAGVQAYFDYVNAHGGVHGRKIQFISLNDQYQPPIALQDTKTLVYTDHVFAEVAVNGTAATEANITVLDPNNVPLVGPQTGATVFAGTLRKNLYNVWPSYLIEGKMLGTFAQSQHLTKVGVLYQNDDFGKSLLQGVQNSGLKPVLAVPYDPTQTDFSPQAAQFKSAHADAVDHPGHPRADHRLPQRAERHQLQAGPDHEPGLRDPAGVPDRAAGVPRQLHRAPSSRRSRTPATRR